MDNHLGYIIFREYSNEVFRDFVDSFGFSCTEVITLTTAPVTIVVSKCIKCLPSHTVDMPVSVYKIYLLLATIRTCWDFKKVISTRKCLIKKRDEIIFHRNFLIHIKSKLAVHCFELVAYFIHTSLISSNGQMYIWRFF